MNGRRAKARRRLDGHAGRESLRVAVPDVHPYDGCGLPVATIVGWCESEDQVEGLKRSTHDAVIRQLGAARRSGVAWRIAQGAGASDLLAVLANPDDKAGHGPDVTSQELHDYYRRLRGLLREYGGFIVVAIAEGEPAGMVPHEPVAGEPMNPVELIDYAAPGDGPVDLGPGVIADVTR